MRRNCGKENTMLDFLKIFHFRVMGVHTGHYTKDLKGRKRPLMDPQVLGIDMSDTPKFVDAYVEMAMWKDTCKNLTENELNKVNDDDYLVAQLVHEHLY